MATGRVSNPSHSGVLRELANEYRYHYVTGGGFMRGTQRL